VSGAIIQLEHVSKRFGQQLAVDDVTLDVPRGRCFAWLGPNGCGKTTLIRMMLGLARPTAGSIRLRGCVVPDDIRGALSRVGGIVEEPRFYPYLSGRRNLDVWAAHHGGEARARIPAVLERVALSERADDKVKTYSLGMRQRLGVARALLNDPELLVLDEPTNGLDPQGTREVRSLITDLARDGVTVFLSSHLLSEVEQICTDVGVMSAGRLVWQGRLADLRDQQAARVRVETAEPTAAADVLGRLGLGEVRSTDGTVTAALGEQAPEAVVAELVRCGVGVRGFAVERASLEEQFVGLTGDGFDVSG
jgi:ABC-2 type transport system ATP-binding protein